MNTINQRLRVAALALLATFAFQPTAFSQETPPEVSEEDKLPVTEVNKDGKSLVVPNGAKSKGQAYYVIPDRDRQIYFESNAPLEDIKGQSNKVIGYAVLSKSKGASIEAGEWHLPIDSLKTGIKLRDEHILNEEWLYGKKHPTVIVQARGFKDAKQTKNTAAFKAYTGTIVADLTLRGVTRTIEIPNSTVAFLAESNATKKVAKGDLMQIRSKFTIKMEDYGIKNGVIGRGKFSETVDIVVSLFLSTLPPDKQ